MDDQQVSVASLKTVLQCQAYILCYSKVRSTPASVTPPSSSSAAVTPVSKGTSVAANKDTQDSHPFAPKNESNKAVATKSTPNTTVKLQPELSIVRAIVASAPKTSMDVADDSSSEIDEEKQQNIAIPSSTKKSNGNAKAASSSDSEDETSAHSHSAHHHSMRLVSRDGYIPANPMR
jgi:hypothetical protein